MPSEPNVVDSISIGVLLKVGARVRLRPRSGGDIFDIPLEGKIAVIEAIEQDYQERLHIAVSLDDDPGREFAELHQPGYHFFFAPEEVEPLIDGVPIEAGVNPPRIQQKWA